MDVDNRSLINQNPINTESKQEEILFGENKEKEQPSSSLSADTLQTFKEEDRESATRDAPEVNLENLHLAEHRPRSRTRSGKPSNPLRVHNCNSNCNDRLPPLESEQQFRIAITKCARGGDSMERNSVTDETKVLRDVPNLSPLILKIKPIIISSSPTVKGNLSTKAKQRRTAAEVDAFFTRLSTPKYINGKVLKTKKSGDRVQQMSAAQRHRCEATKGLCVKIVRTRSNSTLRSGSRHSSLGK